MIVRSRAPLRLSFAGGGTDISPFKDLEGGCVLSATINHFVYGTLHTTDTNHTTIHSLDYDIVSKYQPHSKKIHKTEELSLVKAVIQRLHSKETGAEIFLQSDAPPGSGLGSSSTMVVTLIGLFQQLRGLPLTRYEIAEIAYEIERIDLQMKGGLQDQYAAAFGGFNFIEFERDRVVVNPLRIDPYVVNELQFNLLLCNVGRTRLSESIIDAQIKNVEQKDESAIQAMREQKTIAIEMKNCLLTGKIYEFAEYMDHAWETKKRMAAEISNPLIDEMYSAAKANGAIGGKILGAGGGGFLAIFCESGRKHLVGQALENLGGTIVNFGFHMEGLQTWTAPDAR